MISNRGLKVVLSGAIDRTIENIDISVKIDKTISSIPNQSIITIYNLKAETRSQLQNKNYDISGANIDVKIYLKDSLLFNGKLANSNTILNKNEATFITTLWCSDGIASSFAETNIKIDKGATKTNMIDTLIGELSSIGGIAKGSIDKLKDCAGGKSIAKSIILNGNILENIKKILKDCLLDNGIEQDVFIEDGKINILPKNENIKEDTTSIIEGYLEPPSLNDTGVSIKLIIEQSFKIGSLIKIEIENKNIAIGNLTSIRANKQKILGEGTYKITQISYVIDNFSDDVAYQTIGALSI